ncbi:hypothetical protein ACLB1O_15115 [Escherichia coli]
MRGSVAKLDEGLTGWPHSGRRCRKTAAELAWCCRIKTVRRGHGGCSADVAGAETE